MSRQRCQQWAAVRLDELGTVERGRSRHRPRNAPHLYGGPYPFVQTGDIKAAGLRVLDFSQTYSAAGLAQSRLWPVGTLCITIAANICDTAILGIPACFPDSVVGFTADPQKADTIFVKYALDLAKRRFTDISRGATQDNLSVEKMLSQQLLIPPLPIQRRIASILGAYDDLIEVNRRRIAVLEEMARRLFDEWFIHFRFPGHEGQKVVEAEGSDLPNGWFHLPLREICDFQSGFAFKSSTFSEGGSLKLVTIKNIHDGRFNPVCDSRIEVAPSNMPPHCRLEEGDICMSLTGNVGRVCLVYGQDYLLNQRVAKLWPTHADFYSYLYLLSRSVPMQKRLIQISNGVAQQNPSPIQAGNLHVVTPPRSVAKRFDDIVKPMLDAMVNACKSNENLATQRDHLLPRLVSGDLPVAHLELGLDTAA